MADASNIKLHIAFNDPGLDAEEREGEAQKLLHDLRQLDEVEAFDRVLDPHPPEGNKALGGFLVGMLIAEVTPAKIKQFFSFLSDRLSGKTIELHIEANGKKLQVKARSQAELMAAIEAAQKFVAL